MNFGNRTRQCAQKSNLLLQLLTWVAVAQRIDIGIPSQFIVLVIL